MPLNNLNIKTITVDCPCAKCGKVLTVETLAGLPLANIVCDPCYVELQAHDKALEKQAAISRRVDYLASRGLSRRWADEWIEAKAAHAGVVRDFVTANRNENIYLASYDSGVNKTWSCAMTAWQMAMKYEVREPMMVVAPDWLARVCAEMGSSATTADYLVRNAIGSDLLIMDDLGRGKISERASEIVWRIIDARQRAGVRTWITANYNLQQLESRFMDNGHTICRRIDEYYVKFGKKDVEKGEGE